MQVRKQGGGCMSEKTLVRPVFTGQELRKLILPLVLAWYIITELGSILENAVKMGAAVPGWLIKLLEAGAKVIESAGNRE